MDVATAVNIITPFTEGWETFSALPYPDAGSYAIGYGNHAYMDGSAVGADDDAISQADAVALMQYYLTMAANKIVGWLQVSQSNNQLAALTDLAYNAGSVYSSLQNLINSGADAQTVADMIENTAVTSQGVVNSGLQDRAAARAQLYLQPDSLIPGLSNTALLIGGAAVAIGAFFLLSD